MHTCTCSFHTTAQVLAWSPDEKYARNAHIAAMGVKRNISDQKENKLRIKDPTQIKSFDSLPCETFAETRRKTSSFLSTLTQLMMAPAGRVYQRTVLNALQLAKLRAASKL